MLLDVPSLRQDAERDKRTTSLGVVDDAGHVVHVSGQLVAIRAAKNALPSVSGLCRCGLARLDHIAGAGDI